MSDHRRSSENNPLTAIATAVDHRDFDLYQPRDWPHRNGDAIRFSLLQMPLSESSPGCRSHPCDACGQDCMCIHDNIKCWKCKAAFCASRCFPQGNVMATPMKTILASGFGHCPSCQEPLRSIALIGVFRTMLESISSSMSTTALPGGAVAVDQGEYGFKNPCGDFESASEHSSLVQEAEEALTRAYKFKSNNVHESAILEFTHAINAINFFASSSSDLVLRPHDILLIAHAERAQLENNKPLSEAILAAYPKASVKSPKKGEETWFLSKSAFCSLFYPPPACILVGAPCRDHDSNKKGLLLRVDMRTNSKEAAFASQDMTKQLRLYGPQTKLRQEEIEMHPHCDDVDPKFSNLQGSWRGLLAHFTPFAGFKLISHEYPALETSGIPDREPRQVQLINMFQFVRVFPSVTAASEYTRIVYERKEIGEEGPPSNAKDCPRMAQMVKEIVNILRGEQGDKASVALSKVYVIRSVNMGIAITSVIAVVGNVSTKICISDVDKGDGEREKQVCMLVARALGYLNGRLVACRTLEQSDDRLHFQIADMAVCAYCGKDSADMKRCTRCKSARYCNGECQRYHWETTGPNSHRTLCKKVSNAAAVSRK